MTDVARTILEYIREQDRAVTISELYENTDLEDEQHETVSRILGTLEENEFISSDGVLVAESLNYTARFYPTDKLHSNNTEQIIQTL